MLDTIQAGAHTLNAFQQLDSDAVYGVFVGSFNSFHQNKTQHRDKLSYRGRNNVSHNNDRMRQSNIYRGYSSSGRFPTRPARQGSYRNFPSQRGSFNNFPRQRGQQ